MGIKIKGLQALAKAYNKAITDAVEATKAAVYQEALDIDRAAVNLVPVDDGFLKGSHYVTRPDSNGEVQVGFGTDYAVPVHDRTEVYHKIGQANYLKEPLDKATAGWAGRVAKRARNNLSGNVRIGRVGGTAPQRPNSRGR